ncbi:MAG TPA: 3-methyl-2-oxobutanoate hydroxymethyltransferase [Selenomonadales bacterium]|nr:3-methyl-2-oxobutanoate hydroxymethyltransferase [Selenomonadales bacterium]
MPALRDMKTEGRKIRMVTAYDYPTGLLVDQTDIEMILVGDSLGMVVLGYDGTVPVTMEEMLHHLKAVARGAKHTLIVGDLPFMSYNISIEEAIRNAGRLMKEGGADCVKLEGGFAVAETIRAIVRAGIPVMAHIGLTPQTASQLGGFKVQGKDETAAERLVAEAAALQEAGAFALVLEAIPAPLAELITRKLAIPTIGIGAGVHCDGQVLVFHDMMGLFDRFVPKFVKRFANTGEIIREALNTYAAEVSSGAFPGPEHSFAMKDSAVLKKLDGAEK